MEAIARSTVKDRYALFQYTDGKGRLREKGFMITINACSDLHADPMCRSVRDFAERLTCDLVLAFENYQWRGGVQIYRPHAHLLVDVEKTEANRIAEYFKRLGADVDVDSMYDTPYLLKYISKDSTGSFYCKQIPAIEGKGSPPPTLPEVEEAVDPVLRVDDRPIVLRNTVARWQDILSSAGSAWRAMCVVGGPMSAGAVRPWPMHMVRLTMIRAP